MIDEQIKATDEDQQEPIEKISLADTIREARDEMVEKTPKPEKAEKQEKSEGKLPTVDPNAPKPFELPGYTKAWAQAARDGILAIGTGTHHRAHLDPILAQLEESNKYITTKEQEYAGFRKSAEPIMEIVGPLEQQYRMQGMTLSQGIGQMVEAARFVANDPDQAFPWFAQMYKPRDPGTAVVALAKQWGVDLGQVTAEQPYVDPQLTALLTPLQQQLAEVRQWKEQQAIDAQRNTHNQIVQEIAALEAATDEAGSLKYPHLKTVFNDIALLVSNGRANNFDDAYSRAVNMNPELSAQVNEARAAEAQKKAIQEAATKSAVVQKAAQSNRTIGGKGQRREPGGFKSLREAAQAALAEHQS
jgi:hypothetical protein